MMKNRIILNFEDVTADTFTEGLEMCYDRVDTAVKHDSQIRNVSVDRIEEGRCNVRIEIELGTILSTFEDPLEFVELYTRDCNPRYVSRTLTFLSKRGWFGRNSYADTTIQEHREELRERGYNV